MTLQAHSQKNMSLPIHRWFRYSAGFSANWVQEVLDEYANAETKVIDPFAGSGTVQLQCGFKNIPSIGLDPHPFVSRIAKAKLSWKSSTEIFNSEAREILNKAKRIKSNK